MRKLDGKDLRGVSVRVEHGEVSSVFSPFYLVLIFLVQFSTGRVVVKIVIVTVPRDALVRLRVGMAIVLQGDIMIANVPLPIEGTIMAAVARPLKGETTGRGTMIGVRVMIIGGGMTENAIEIITMIAGVIARRRTN